jgi:hypothetical protein
MTTTKLPRLMVINEPDGRRFSKALALEIGRDHAEVLLQIEFLISISTTPLMDGKMWTKESVARLQEYHFPYWGRTFISDILNDLCNGYEHIRYSITGEGRARKRISQKVSIPALLEKSWFNETGWDSTTWYTLNLKGIATLTSVKIDEQAFTVTAERKRVPVIRSTRFRITSNPLPLHAQPVTGSAEGFITETPTETPTERGGVPAASYIPTPPPNFPHEFDLSNQGQDQDFNTHIPIVTIRTSSTKTTRAEKIGAFLGDTNGQR